MLLLSDKTIAYLVWFLASHKSRFYQVVWGNQVHERLQAGGSGVQGQLALHKTVSENKPKQPIKSKLYYQYGPYLADIKEERYRKDMPS